MANDVKDFWDPSYDTLYDACYYEFASEYIITRWSQIHVVTAFLAAVTTSGSAVSGWALWDHPSGKVIWGCVAGLASVLTIFHGVLAVPTKIKEEEQRRQQFAALRIDVETFRHSLTVGCNFNEANKAFDKLRERFSSNVSKTPPDIVFTKSARREVQEKVNDKLGKYINNNRSDAEHRN